MHRFAEDWNRRKNGPVIQQLRTEVDKLREEVLNPLLAKMNGKLSDAEKAHIAGAFKLFQIAYCTARSRHCKMPAAKARAGICWNR